MGDDFEFVLLVEQGVIGLRFFEIEAQWREPANLRFEAPVAARTQQDIEFNYCAVGIRISELAVGFFFFGTFARQVYERALDFRLERLIALKQRIVILDILSVDCSGEEQRYNNGSRSPKLHLFA